MGEQPQGDDLEAIGFDPDTLSNLKALLGLALTKLLQDYVDATQKLVAELADISPDSDAETLHRLGHTLKSSSLIVGATHLARLGRDIEDHAKMGETADACALIPDVATELDRARRVLTTLGGEH